MESRVVDVRIRGRGEMTLEAQVRRDETVEEFKKRVFGKHLGEGKQCRVIALGKELRNTRQMGFYKIKQGACLHVMIGPSRTAARAAIAAGGNVQREHKVYQWRTSVMLLTITVSSWVGALVEFSLCGKPFTYTTIGALLLLSFVALTVVFPSLETSLAIAVSSCRWPLLRRTTRT